MDYTRETQQHTQRRQFDMRINHGHPQTQIEGGHTTLLNTRCEIIRLFACFVIKRLAIGPTQSWHYLILVF